MNFNGWSNLEEFARACGYENFNNSNNKSSNNRSETNDGNNINNENPRSETNDGSNINNETDDFFNMGCHDIPCGFQSLNPRLFAVVGEILGDIIAGNLPFNVQNAVGNWLQLVGQVILTYNAQQQYFQGGPGRYFNPKYYNVSNPFCQNTSGNTEGNTSSGDVTYNNDEVNSNTSNRSDSKKNKEKFKDKSNTKNNNDDIKKLKKDINMLMEQVEEIKNRINDIENF